MIKERYHTFHHFYGNCAICAFLTELKSLHGNNTVFTLNFLTYRPSGPASWKIYRPTINSTGPNLEVILKNLS